MIMWGVGVSGADVGDGAGVYVMVVNEVVGFRSG